MGRCDGAYGGVGVSLVLHAGKAREQDASVPAEGAKADLGENKTARDTEAGKCVTVRDWQAVLAGRPFFLDVLSVYRDSRP